MQHPESYCHWCGRWQELPFYKAICRECYEGHLAQKSK